MRGRRRWTLRSRTMRIAVIGAGAVGGYYGAMLARAGHDVTLIARGRAPRGDPRTRPDGARVARRVHACTPAHPTAPGEIGPVDLVLLAVKTYDNDTALPMLRPLTGPGTAVLTLQNGVDSPAEAAAVIGGSRVLGGAAYIATAVAAPGIIEQTGTHHRIVFGEAFDAPAGVSARAAHASRTLRGRRDRGGGRARRPRAAVGEVYLPRPVRRLHRRRTAADRSALAARGDARPVHPRVRGGGGGRAGRRRSGHRRRPRPRPRRTPTRCPRPPGHRC